MIDNLTRARAQLVADTKNIVADIADQLESLLAEAIRTNTKIDFAKLPIAADAQHELLPTRSLLLPRRYPCRSDGRDLSLGQRSCGVNVSTGYRAKLGRESPR